MPSIPIGQAPGDGLAERPAPTLLLQPLGSVHVNGGAANGGAAYGGRLHRLGGLGEGRKAAWLAEKGG